MTLTLDLLTLKVVSESHVTWVISVPILVFLGLSVFDLGPMYATDSRQTDRRQTASSLSMIAMQNLIGMWTSVRSQNFSAMVPQPPSGLGIDPKNTPTHALMCYHAEFRRSTSNGMGINREVPIVWERWATPLEMRGVSDPEMTRL